MEIWQAIVLGVIQGLTEFLPVSSSGHLIMGEELLGSPLEGNADLKLAFDVALHGGTLLALLIYFRHDGWGLLKGGVNSIRTRSMDDPYAKLFWLIGLGTIPAVAAVLTLSSLIEWARDPVFAATMLILFTGFFFLGEKLKGEREIWDLSWRDAIIIGCWQALALLPGTSRSGATIVGGMSLGLDRSSAARFSFLLSLPAVTAAQIKEMPVILGGAPGADLQFHIAMAAGVAAAFISGLIAINWLLRFLSGHPITWFAAYRIPVGVLFLVWYLSG